MSRHYLLLTVLPRCLGDGRAERRRIADPAEQRHQLATVADAERKCVGAPAKSVKLDARALIEENAARPAFGGAENVGEAEAANKRDAAERRQLLSAGGDVAHRYVERLKTG